MTPLKNAMVIFLTLIFLDKSAKTARGLSISRYKIDDSKGLGRRFDGIGAISGGGATSKLLVNYPEEQRNQILDFLFKPNFGASLQILKVEIGGDSDSSDGSEASHMHYPWDENYERGYEWWLMKEAKKRNPDIVLYALPWGFPGWLGNGTRDPYYNPELTASYIIKYILGAKRFHNLTFDFIGIWNERNFSMKYTEILRYSLDAASLQHVRIVAADDLWEPISSDIAKYPSLSKVVDIIGVHYPGTKGNKVALSSGKPLWSSEDYSLFNNNTGASHWARMLNQNYVNGFMTCTIAWNLIASYYESPLPFTRDSLMTADSPWSGYYRVESPIWMTAHTTQFTHPGWLYTHHNEGVSFLEGGGSMVTLQSLDKKDFTIVIETMSFSHSTTQSESGVKPQTLILQLSGSFARVSSLNVWFSKLRFDGHESRLMMNLGSQKVINETITLFVDTDEVYTLTTLKTGAKGEYPDPPPQKSFPLPYTDDFESYEDFSEPFNLAQQVGSYEVISTPSSHGKVMRQMVTEFPCNWCVGEEVNKSINIIGDSSWSDIYVEFDAQITPENGTSGIMVAAHISKGGCRSYWAKGIFVYIFPQRKVFKIYADLLSQQKLYEGKITFSVEPYDWMNLGLLMLVSGKHYEMKCLLWNGVRMNTNRIHYIKFFEPHQNTSAIGYLNNYQLFSISVPDIPPYGVVGLGTADYGLADFDNLRIDTLNNGLDRLRRQVENKYKSASL